MSIYKVRNTTVVKQNRMENKGNKGDLIKLFNRDYLARLDNIKQWLEYDRHQQESVSQHSFKVSVFAMSLLEYLWPSDTQRAEVWLFKYQTLKLALMHDFDEAILRRDITHELKYNNYNGGEIRNVLDKFVNHQLTEEFGEESDVVKTFSKEDKFYDVMHAIVKVADWMALLYFLNRELAIGNRSWPLNLLPYCKDNYYKAVSTLRNTCIEMGICTTSHSLYASEDDIIDLLKNIIFIADSLKAVKEKNPKLKFKMLYVGSGQDSDKLVEHIKKIGLENDVIMCGRVMDRYELSCYYKRADLFLFPSVYDTSGIVRIEAASQSTPGLFLKDTATASTITENVNGFLSEYTVGAYSDKIIEIMNDKYLYDKVSKNAYIDLYKTWDEQVNEAYEIYLELIKKKKR